MPGLGLDDGVDRFAPLVGRHAEHGGVHDVGMGVQHRLDLGRVDVHPAADDHVLLAVADVDVALVVDVGDVADRLPAVAVADGLGRPVVAVDRQGAADEQLARLPGGQFLAVLAHDLDLDGAVGLAARARLAQLVLGRQDRVDAQLGRAVDLEQEAVAELGDDLLLQRVRHRRGVGDERAHRREVGRARTSSGSDTMRLSCVGAENVLVTRCWRTRSIQRSASKWRSTTMVPPSVWVRTPRRAGPSGTAGRS